MQLGDLLKSVKKKYKTISINGICFDSRKLKKKDVFFAIEGNKNSGNNFINDVIKNGASSIVSNNKVKLNNNLVPHIVVKNVRKSLTEACSNFYKKKPSKIVAVTGTNGKSSVADFFYQILAFNKISVASIGTLGIFSTSYHKKTNLTSIDPLSLHRNLQILKEKKINNVILEASSHGLKQQRLNNLKIKVGIFTNLSHDHLDYHKNMKSYLNSKMFLFNNLLNKKSKIITNSENKEFKIINNIAKRRKLKIITIGSNTGNIKILQNNYKKNKQIVKILYNSKEFLLEIPLIGYFQIENLLMAVLAASACGLKQKKILKYINKIKPVSGRLECVANLKNNSNIIIDFAHTPDALEQSLLAVKKHFKKRIIIVFGCGGERDKNKRFIMGRIAKKYCRKIIVTDDNPRNEDPAKIRQSIINACKEIAVNIPSRKKAIRFAINELRANEVLLISGKGHETIQDYGDRKIFFSDKKEIKKLIKKKNFSFRKYSWPNLLGKEVFNRENLDYNGISINSKTLKKNNLFFAIKGKNVDGHNFIKEAIQNGASKCIVSKKIKIYPQNKIIKVKNTFSDFNNLAKTARKFSEAKIIGITGSAGKTTLKNLTSFVLKNYGNVHSSPHSYNNKFGVPFSLSNLKSNTEYGVFEIGMDKRGEIDYLSKMVMPEVAVITNITEAHLENFNTIKDIANAKSEIINNISKDGSIILNKDDKFFNFLFKKAKNKGINIISFSANKKADIYLSKIKKKINLYQLKIVINKKSFYFDTKIRTKIFLDNILACVSILFALNLNLDYVKKRFINFSLPEGRGDIKLIKKFNKKFKFIDESYNSNPLSMRAAIKNMNSHKRGPKSKKLALLGDMLELGKNSNKLHKELSISINKSDIDKVYVYGKYIKETFKSLTPSKRGIVFNSLNEAYSYFGKTIHNNDLLMVKGSNATGLNNFSKNIKKKVINAL